MNGHRYANGRVIGRDAQKGQEQAATHLESETGKERDQHQERKQRTRQVENQEFTQP